MNSFIIASFLIPFLFNAAPTQTSSVPSFTLTPGQSDSDDSPTSGATLCLQVSKDICFQMPSMKNGDATFDFAFEPHAKLVSGTDWLLFDSQFYGGGSGTLTRYAILRKDGEGPTVHLVNLLPEVALTNISELAMWNLPHVSAYPILVAADFIWDFKAKETHFSRHRYAIDVWCYSSAQGLYIKTFSYQTVKKYDGGDSTAVNAIELERNEIRRRLSSSKP